MFTPEQNHEIKNVPYYEDAKAKDGWQGQRTGKTLNTLKSEVSQSIEKLGGLITRFQRGSYSVGNHNRNGFQVWYMIETPDGITLPGRIDVAALPVKSRSSKAQDESLCMALYMLRMALDGTWFLQQLSPGYSALMPFMLADSQRTISQVWGESAMRNLLPPPDAEFIEGVVVVA